ncbi:MAG: DUF1045 domain-containing protein [Sulfitobacter sp.]|nr:DUF1045 domain-containing protein [Sulfitobacter sp.]
MSYTRYAIYFVPHEDGLAAFGARWLGWDANRHRPVAQFDLEGLSQVTDRPRKYGFHGTLKPPFRLSEGATEADLRAELTRLAAHTAPAPCEGLALAAIGRFLALVPEGSQEDISRLAGACVTAFDPFRAPLSDDDLARRRKGGLSPRQEDYLMRWGYPYVMDEFRFHLTLTGPLPRDELELWRDHAASLLPDLPRPFTLSHITLLGEREDGKFDVLQHERLAG